MPSSQAKLKLGTKKGDTKQISLDATNTAQEAAKRSGVALLCPASPILQQVLKEGQDACATSRDQGKPTLPASCDGKISGFLSQKWCLCFQQPLWILMNVSKLF